MSETKFTKGEWEIDGLCVYALNEDGCNQFSTTVSHDFKASDDECKANAHLMKAAPKMYEFLEGLQLDVTNDYKRDELLAEARGDQC